MDYKKFITVAIVVALACGSVDAQNVLGRLTERAKNAAENAIGNKIENAINGAVDKATTKKDRSNSNKREPSDASASSAPSVPSAAPVSASAAPSPAPAPAPSPAPEFQNAKMSTEENDFVPGSVVLFEDDLVNEKQGEFPSKWDICRGSVGVADLGGRKVIKFENDGTIYPLLEKDQYNYLPEEFTIEFDFYASKPNDNDGQMYFLLALKNREQGLNTYEEYSLGSTQYHCGHIQLWWAPNLGGRSSVVYRLQKPGEGSTAAELLDQDNTGKITGIKVGWNHFALAFNKRALKVYINGMRVINVPNMIAPKYFELGYYYNDTYPYSCIAGFRLGTNGAELYERNATDLSAVEKSMQESGKFVTNNILFETGKATLKPESMTDIKSVADYMKKNSSARFEVQGHCDNQGSDSVNDPLSQKRAEAIVAELVKLGVDEWNLRAVGKGSHEPVADNATEEGRAKNRRVEFIKK